MKHLIRIAKEVNDSYIFNQVINHIDLFMRRLKELEKKLYDYYMLGDDNNLNMILPSHCYVEIIDSKVNANRDIVLLFDSYKYKDITKSNGIEYFSTSDFNSIKRILYRLILAHVLEGCFIDKYKKALIYEKSKPVIDYIICNDKYAD